MRGSGALNPLSCWWGPSTGAVLQLFELPQSFRYTTILVYTRQHEVPQQR
jgi:hypothetical protein